MSSDSNGSSGKQGGIGVLGLLGVIFVTLKLLGISQVASWSWWWVTAPFWGVAAFILAIVLVGSIFVIIKSVLER